MRAVLAVGSVVCAVALVAGCGASDVVRSDCERKGTALIVFQNQTPETTFDVYSDSNRLGTISPGETLSRDVSAGLHTMRCCPSVPGDSCTSLTDTLAVCSQTTVDCALPGGVRAASGGSPPSTASP